MLLDPSQVPLPHSPQLTSHSNESSESIASNINSNLLPHHPIMSINAESSETGSSIKVLESHNYHHWNDLMLSYFLEHNIDGIVDGTETQPTSSLSDAQNWLLRQKKAAGFIARKLDSSNQDLFINDSTRRDPHSLWQAIQVQYASTKARNRS